MLYVLKTFLMNKWRGKPQNRKEKRSTKLSQEVLRDRSIFQWSKGQAYAYEKEKMFKEKVAKAFKNQGVLAT